MKYSLAFFILLGSIFQLHSENTPIKLSGKIISTKNCYNTTSNYCTTTENIALNAFDGNLQTSFATCNGSGGWVGLDLGEPAVITKVAYCPRAGQQQQMVLGVFEGANNPDFGDAIPIYVIANAPAQNTMTTQPVICSKGFRYVRYVGPNDSKCNIAELEFYGYQSAGDNLNLNQTTNLPSVIIHTTNAQDIVDRENYLKGIVSVISENGTKIFSDSLNIKGRGNFSWSFPKKPYRMKLYHKASLLGFPAVEKSWTLINNYGDKTLMRNLLAFDLSKRLEMPYTPAGKPVDVFLNGEYKGTYQLCDQVEVATNRVEIETMKTSDIALPALGGGYFIEMDTYANEGTSWFTSARNGIPVTIHNPKDDEIVPAQSAFIKAHFEKMENALYSTNYTDLVNGYRKYIDTETFIRQFLVGEISGNTDTYWSTYMYKKRNEDKFYFDPVWDFDIAFENDYRTYPINNNPNWIYASTGSSANGVKDLVDRLFSDPSFQKQLKSIYAMYRTNFKLNEKALLQVVDDYAAQIDRSQKLNFTRWNILNTQVHMNPLVWGSYAAEVANVKNYIKNRITWMDNKLGYIPTGVTENTESPVYLWSERNTLHIEGLSESASIQIIDITGRKILTEHANTHFTTSLKQGVYLVNISDKTAGNKVSKCIIQE